MLLFSWLDCTWVLPLDSHSVNGISMISAQHHEHVVPPPSVPDFMYKGYSQPFRNLIIWAKEEYQARLDYCAKRGYFRQHQVYTKNYSPMRVLAEMSGFRRFCSLMTDKAWSGLSRAERKFIVGAFELRDILMR